MQLSSILFLFVCLQASAATYAQQMTIQGENIPLKTIFRDIRKQTGYNFIYANKALKKARPVTLQEKNAELSHILNAVFKDQPLSYAIEDKLIVVSPKKERKKVERVGETVVEEPDRQITGTVTDEATGDSLVGVTVRIKNSTTGTVTGSDGRFNLSVPEDAVLEVSFVGYTSKEVQVGSNVSLNISLAASATGLDQLVVVGYGTQKKSDLTGSVSVISTDDLSNKTIDNLSEGLAGLATGITAIQGSGQPGLNQAALSIRGMGTFSDAGTSPLIIIDGIPGDINNVDPGDVKSITVLKDAASAAIYGSRAANGVILVETKDGRGDQLELHYHSFFGWEQPTELPEYADSWVYAEMLNRALINSGSSARYSEEDIHKFQSGVDKDNFPNAHHVNDLFKSNNGFRHKHNISFNQRKEGTGFYASLGYSESNGLVKNTNFKKYNFLARLNSRLLSNLILDLKFEGNISNRNNASMIYTNGEAALGFRDIMRAASSMPTAFPDRKSDGTYGTHGGHPSAFAGLDLGGFEKNQKDYLLSFGSLKWEVLKYLSLNLSIDYSRTFERYKLFAPSFDADPSHSFGPSMARIRSTGTTNLRPQFIVNYDQIIGKHNVKGLLGINQTKNNNLFLEGYRENFPTSTLSELGAASTQNQQATSGGADWDLRSIFGRIDYSFLDKYLIQFNFREDGSSRFPKGRRYGFFPSASAGWIISRESFLNKVSFVNFLKIRGSYGLLGNQNIGIYPYQRVLTTGEDYPIGEILRPGVRMTTLPFRDLTWEKTFISNLGIDAQFFSNRLEMNIDFYNKLTEDVLYQLSVSHVLGFNVSEQNGGKVRNRGLEFNLKYRESFGKLKFNISGNFSVNENRVIDLFGVERDVNKGLFVGHPVSSIYGYRTDGLFISEEDIANYPIQNYEAKPGLPRYVDISGPNGQPDGIISADFDRTVIGNTFPKYHYGMNLDLEFKGLSVFFLLQGQGGNQELLSGTRFPFYNETGIESWQVKNQWTEGKSRYTQYTILIPTYNEPEFDGDQLEYWLRNSSFLRIKNIRIGYKIPNSIWKGLDIEFVRNFEIYGSVQNLKTFDHFVKGWDPEMQTAGYRNSAYYPPTRFWALGFNVDF